MFDTNQTQIRELLATYERSLNTSDAPLAASVYAKGGLFMPTSLPSAAGEHLEDSYRHVFGAIKLNVAFTIEELVVTSENSAYAITQSKGTQVVLATETESAEANREIFIFTREDNAWKISRYMFNKAS
jgi:ketosteroid isomerase-like protein